MDRKRSDRMKDSRLQQIDEGGVGLLVHARERLVHPRRVTAFEFAPDLGKPLRAGSVERLLLRPSLCVCRCCRDLGREHETECQ